MDIPLNKGKIAVIDDSDFDLVKGYTWFVRASPYTFYAVTTINKYHQSSQFIRMHRLILGAKKGQIVDHKDSNGLNNRRANLRICNRSENDAHCRIYKNNTTGFKGVTYHKKNKHYIAQIKVRNHYKYLGHFPDAISAAIAYNKAALRLHGEFALLNIIIEKEG